MAELWTAGVSPLTQTRNGGQCVEAASGHGSVLVRDTTDRDGVTLAFPVQAWERLIASLR